MVVVGTSLDRDPGARVAGNEVNMTLRQALAGQLGQWLRGYPLPGPTSPIFWWRQAGLILMAVVLMIVSVLFPVATSRVAGEIALHPARSLLWGILIAVLAIPATILLFITILGIPLAGLLWLALACAYYLGFAGLSDLIGRKLLVALGSEQPDIYLATLLGVVVVGMIGWLPYVGLIAGGLIKTAGLGAATLTLVGRRR